MCVQKSAIVRFGASLLPPGAFPEQPPTPTHPQQPQLDWRRAGWAGRVKAARARKRRRCCCRFSPIASPSKSERFLQGTRTGALGQRAEKQPGSKAPAKPPQIAGHRPVSARRHEQLRRQRLPDQEGDPAAFRGTSAPRRAGEPRGPAVALLPLASASGASFPKVGGKRGGKERMQRSRGILKGEGCRDPGM